MPYLQQSIQDAKTLLTHIKSFSVTHGWTLVYDGLNDSDLWQVGLSKGNCHVSLGMELDYYGSNLKSEKSFTDAVLNSTVKDGRLCITLATSLDPTKKKYWGHPGGIASNGGDTAKTAYLNDCVGPFPNVWLFTNATGDYIHCVFQRDDRFSTFIFGLCDTVGSGLARSAYCGSTYYNWWSGTTDPGNYSYEPNQWWHDQHDFFITDRAYAFQVMVPTGILNTVYGFSSGPFVSQFIRVLMSKKKSDSEYFSNNNSQMLDLCCVMENQTTTGGIPLFGLPLIYYKSGWSCWIGLLPDIRYVNMDGLNPGDDLVYGGDTWTVFPWKKMGTYSASNAGTAPKIGVNTLNKGWALKKIS